MFRANLLLCLKKKISWNNTKFILFHKYRSSRNQIVLLHRSFASSSNPSIPENEIKSDSESDSDSDTNSQEKAKLTSVRLQILHAGLNYVNDHGWTKKSVALGAQSIGLSSASHTLISSEGADLVHYFNFLCNESLEAYLKSHALEIIKEKNFQEYLECALEKRLSMVYPFAARWNEALSLMVLPTQVPIDLENMLELVNIIWRYSEDNNLNMTWYSKRLSLALAYRLCELSLIQDKSPDFLDSQEFLKKRVENVVYSEEFLNQVISSGQHLPKYGQGALTTIQNIFGLNRWFR